MKKISKILFVSFLILNTSCVLLNKSRPTELDTMEKGVKMDIKKFFNGEIEGFAITQNSAGKIIDTKTIKISGRWDDTKGTIRQESTSASSDKKENRTWLVSLFEDGTFDAIGHDVSSTAKGIQINNAARMNYSLLLQKDGVKKETKFEDKMYLIDEKSMIMISSFDAGSNNRGKTIISLKKIGSKSDSLKSEVVKFDNSKADNTKADNTKADNSKAENLKAE